MAADSFYDVLNRAVNEINDHGFDGVERLNYWVSALRVAIQSQIKSPAEQQRFMSEALTQIYARIVGSKKFVAQHGLEPYTLAKLTPKMQAELQKRINASAQLIKLNRDEAIEASIRRFVGWATSVPEGGAAAADNDKVEAKANVKKSIKQLTYVERRLVIDQGHKLTAAINEVTATNNGAIAVKWHSNWRSLNYRYREDHKRRDGKIYLLRESWAREKGLVKPGENGCYEDITGFGEEVFCRCYGEWIYSLRKLDDDMITQKGRDEMANVRAKINGLKA